MDLSNGNKCLNRYTSRCRSFRFWVHFCQHNFDSCCHYVLNKTKLEKYVASIFQKCLLSKGDYVSTRKKKEVLRFYYFGSKLNKVLVISLLVLRAYREY